MAVRSTLAEAGAAWRSQGAPNPVCAIGQQVLAEVLNNVVEHAMANQPDGAGQLQTGWSGTQLTCIVRDNGHPMPGLQLPQGRPATIPADPKDLPEGGFGWFMIRSLTQDLMYERADGWNKLSFAIAENEQSHPG